MKLLNKEIICYFDGYNIKDNYDTCVSSYQDDKSFSQNKFEILSEDEEIDIDSIEELDEEIGYIYKDENIKTKWTSNEKILALKQNEIIKAIKQINKKLEEK